MNQVKRTLHISNWAFAQFPPHQGSDRNIVALLGTVDGRFLPGSGRLVKYDSHLHGAVTDSGTLYLLGDVDPECDQQWNGHPVQALTNLIERSN